MNRYRKEKKNPSSRYSRVEEPWLDDDDQQGPGTYGGDAVPNGYGVPDSYTRQASYGRPEGYYDRYPEDELYRNDPYGDDPYRDDPYRDGSYGDVPGGGPYDRETADAYDSEWSYEDDPRAYGGRERYYEDDPRAYGSRERYYEEDPRAYGGRERPYEDDPRASGDDKKKKKDKSAGGKSKKGFVIKLILLLIAVCVLALVWRFSRMKHISLKDILTNAGVTSPSGFKEFVIYGVDSREGNLTEDAHSDTIIVCSMNESTKEVRMVSVYRDTYLDNTNGEYRKATECYYFGGPSRSVNMLNKNLDLDLHDYITVDFNAVVKAVDLIGGVDVEVTEEELPYINGYQTENAQVTGAQITPVESAGYQHLNGIQALAYCRIRYTEGWDYRRTERQRAVLSQIFEQAKSQGPVRMAQIVDTMLPYIATSFSSPELLSIASAISGSTMVDSVGFPFEQQAANVSAGDCVIPVNLAQNVSELHAYLYQQSGYTPTQTVQEISNEIANTTGIY